MKDRKARKQVKVVSSLDEQTLGYFKRVEDVINDDDFEDEESRKLFVENVFTQVENNEVKLFCDLAISSTMEKLVFYLSDIQIRKIVQNVEEHFSKIAMDKFGSHVLQTLVCITPRALRSERGQQQDVLEEHKDLKSAEELFLSLCSCLQENLPELVNHMYGSHVVRAAFEVLGGVKVSDLVVRSRASRQTRKKGNHSEEKKAFIKIRQVGTAFGSDAFKEIETVTVAIPESFPPVLKRFTKLIIKMELQKLVLHPVSNPLLQTLLLVLHAKNQSLCMKLCKAVMSQIDMFSSKAEKIKVPRKPNDDDNKNQSNDGESNYRIPVLFSNEISSYMIEKILHVVTPELWQEIYDAYFDDHLPELAHHPIANFIVQHLMTSVTDKTQAKQIIAELLPYLEDLLAVGHMGVVVRMVDTAVKFEIKQKKILKALLKAFHCNENTRQSTAVVLIASLTTYDIFFEMKLNGSNTSENDNASEGSFSKLSGEKQGSRVVEACWRNAEVKYKEAITEELAINEQKLKANFYGRIVLKHCGVEHFKRKDKTWHEREQKAAKKRKLLEDILEERGDESLKEKSAKPMTQTKFSQLAPEMATLGFTSHGKQSRDFEKDSDIDRMDITKESPKRAGMPKGEKRGLNECAKQGSSETEDLPDMGFIDEAVKNTKSAKKSGKMKRKEKQK
ncbi:nucleolar protein 9-like isoform X2 [Montipora foliosa]|uniref:nucleolar protein 9-like isoform X2 n=1 Tax=Montipora foliosa TaxID=591990 RepID=UPI0035F117CB